MNATGPASPTSKQLQSSQRWADATSSSGMTRSGKASSASASQFHRFYDLMPLGILLVDAEDLSLIAFNPTACEELGFEHEEFAALALTDLDLMKTGDELIALLRTVQLGNTLHLETRHRQRDGKPRDRLIQFSPFDCDGESSILAVCSDITEQRQADEERRGLLRRLYRAGEDVRRQIAHELHDGVGQDLTGLLLGLSALQDEIPDQSGREAFQELTELAGTIGKKLQRISREQATSLEDVGLLPALESFTNEWARRNGVTLDLQEVGLGGNRLGLDVETTAHRIVQALLIDLAGNVTTRAVSIVVERRRDILQIIIEHDGEADEPDDEVPDRTHGRKGTEERLSFVGGSLTVESGCGLGTTIYVRIPLVEAASEALG